jgi:hypothetical protein
MVKFIKAVCSIIRLYNPKIGVKNGPKTGFLFYFYVVAKWYICQMVHSPNGTFAKWYIRQIAHKPLLHYVIITPGPQ